jgi:predicted Zn-ribbon and HTH transcriptional regulator
MRRRILTEWSLWCNLLTQAHRRLNRPRHLAFARSYAYHNGMLSAPRTLRQRIIDLLTDTRMTTDQLARMLSIPVRQVEEHLAHVVKTVARDRSRRFVLEPSICLDCGFMFRDRTKLTRPSRCPQCRSEGISAPRYGIDSLGSGSTQTNTKVSRRRDAWKGSP